MTAARLSAASDPVDARPSDVELHQHPGNGHVRPCDIDMGDGWCHAHRMWCTLAPTTERTEET